MTNPDITANSWIQTILIHFRFPEFLRQHWVIPTARGPLDSNTRVFERIPVDFTSPHPTPNRPLYLLYSPLLLLAIVKRIPMTIRGR
ncbi:hypothetical protein CDAR_92611 [Caerostris darwini]|uniref:Uncharacterized protein n=1 Tax=Caerostris darwini TaxID=1538125 RepID=A0AAV4RSY1_9ARAC|nr:hypothetical protein CDAR_92611 [Caerostris darwini]